MKNQLLQTPEGVRDIYSDECEKKQALEAKLRDVLKSFGFHGIETPTFEFFDIFGKQIGTTPSRDLYKFFDREGNTLVLRPDITPSIARCASTYYMEDSAPVRFSYIGNVFINNHSYQGRLKENTQLGAELIGDDSVAADAEMIALAVSLFRNAGLKEFQISIGHVDYLKGLFAAAELGEEKEEEIMVLLNNRNFYGIQEVIADENLNDDLLYLFGLMKDVMLTRDKLNAAKERAKDYPQIYNALDRLVQLEDVLRIYNVEKHVFYELAMTTVYTYYTGIIFAGYTYGSGEALVNGGRYDKLLPYFGKNAPAIGFAVIVNQLLSALRHQNINIPTGNRIKWIVYDPAHTVSAIQDAMKLREQGEHVELMPINESNTVETYEAYAKRSHVEDIVYYI